MEKQHPPTEGIFNESERAESADTSKSSELHLIQADGPFSTSRLVERIGEIAKKQDIVSLTPSRNLDPPSVIVETRIKL